MLLQSAIQFTSRAGRGGNADAFSGNRSAPVVSVSSIGQADMWIVWCLGALVGISLLLSMLDAS